MDYTNRWEFPVFGMPLIVWLALVAIPLYIWFEWHLRDKDGDQDP